MPEKDYGRRSNAVTGFVNFPIHDRENTHEGGMWVILVVVDTIAEAFWNRPRDGETDEQYEAARTAYDKVAFEQCHVDSQIHVRYGEEFVGDDVHEYDTNKYRPNLAVLDTLSSEDCAKLMDEYLKHQFCDAHEYHFPQCSTLEQFDSPNEREFTEVSADYLDYVANRFLSRPYLASVMLGTTGWSGHTADGNERFRCTYDDLTDEGKQLYNLFKSLYADNGKLYLLTFLDT